MADQRHPESGSCERRTCLKWQPSGELSEHDFANLMELLLVADQELHADDHCDLKQRLISAGPQIPAVRWRGPSLR